MSTPPWHSAVLGSRGVAIISSGGTPSRTRPAYFGGTVPWVKSGDLNDSIVYSTSESISEEGLASSAARILPQGTVLVAMYGATVGKTAILGTTAATNQAVCSIQPARDQFNPPFLQFLLMHLRPSLLRERYGGAQPNISQTIIRALKLPQPEISEQQKIAAVLWKLQRAIATQDRLLAATADLKQSAMQRLFTHGLKGEPLKDTEIGPMPESWATTRLDACCDVVSSSLSYTDFGVMGDSNDGDAVDTHGVKVSDMNLPGNEFSFVTANLSRRIPLRTAQRKAVPPGTVVFPKRGAAIATNKKRTTTTWTVLDPNLIGVRAKEGLDQRYIYSWFENFDLRTITELGPTPQLNKKNLVPLVLPIPATESEQRAIAAALATIDKKLAHHRAKRASLHDLFETLLHKLMTAEIRVADLDIDTSEVESAAQGEPA